MTAPMKHEPHRQAGSPTAVQRARSGVALALIPTALAVTPAWVIFLVWLFWRLL
jgi:hypothetical protein